MITKKKNLKEFNTNRIELTKKMKLRCIKKKKMMKSAYKVIKNNSFPSHYQTIITNKTYNAMLFQERTAIYWQIYVKCL